MCTWACEFRDVHVCAQAHRGARVSQRHPRIHLGSDLQSPAHLFTYSKTHTSSKAYPRVPTCVLMLRAMRAHVCASSGRLCVPRPRGPGIRTHFFRLTDLRPCPTAPGKETLGGPPQLRPSEAYSDVHALCSDTHTRAQTPQGMHTRIQSHGGVHTREHTHRVRPTLTRALTAAGVLTHMLRGTHAAPHRRTPTYPWTLRPITHVQTQ